MVELEFLKVSCVNLCQKVLRFSKGVLGFFHSAHHEQSSVWHLVYFFANCVANLARDSMAHHRVTDRFANDQTKFCWVVAIS